ncbi:MAG: kinase [Elusimicrobia bacterium]|nr:kinase [Elusimicrobiota bacterium]
MIISRTPFRVSFFGGGTDYPAWISAHGGAVLSTSIDKYCYLTARKLPPFFEYRSRIVYSNIELVKENRDIEHPAVRGILDYLKITDGVEIHHHADLPSRTGLGSSSSFAVGLLHALHALEHRMADKTTLAREAIHVEQEVLKENVGCQDQVIASFGGFCRIDFAKTGGFQVAPLTLSTERVRELENHLLLYFTGFSRIASIIVKEQLERIKDTQSELSRMREMVDEASGILMAKGPLAPFGKLLDESWQLKRKLSSKVSSPAIDDIYEAARSAGALGGKLLGAGGGGFMLIFAEPKNHARIRERLKHLTRIPVNFENEGSRIMVYQPDAVYESPVVGGL